MNITIVLCLAVFTLRLYSGGECESFVMLYQYMHLKAVVIRLRIVEIKLKNYEKHIFGAWRWDL